MTSLRRFGRQHEADPDPDARRIDRQSLSLFRRLLRYVQPYRLWLGISVVALLFSVALGLVLPLVIRNLVDIVLIDENISRLNTIAALLFLVFFVQAIFSFAHRLTLSYVGERTIADIRIRVFSHLQRLSLRFYAARRTGEIISRLTADVSLLQDAITTNLVALLRQLLTLLGAVVLLFVLNWRLTLVILAAVPIVTLLMVFLGRKIRLAATQVQDHLAQAAAIVEEAVGGIRIVKSFTREGYEIARFSDAVNETFTAAMHRARVAAVLGPLIGFMAFASITITLWFGSYEVIQGRLTPGGLVAYLVYTMMVATPIASLAGLYAQFQSALGAAERLFSLLDVEPDIVEQPDAPDLPPIRGEVTFENVSFDYDGVVPILRDVSFQVQSGQLIAVVGPSGAGKTTLVNLIPRLYDVAAGRITIDGYDLRRVTIHSLRAQIGLVPQETILFSDTVRANIRYGRLDATQAEIEAAARAANAHGFIMEELSNGYDTLVGERGVKLSGGQRQRIAIARALLKDPAVLILDEATSSLDSESEALVQEALERLLAGRTSFVIAHRLSTVLDADQILVLDRGQLVEQGRHETLLRNRVGLYHRLYEMQFERGTEEVDRAPAATPDLVVQQGYNG
ncbi:MAG: ABC transporter ATP-binding protein [Candidatus Promineifilaceae bacterium]|nr:ABC transporter ATP-binding protein [Candidatus Promineifilaceae bacterium]